MSEGPLRLVERAEPVPGPGELLLLAVQEIDRLIRKARLPRSPQEAVPAMTLLMPELIVRNSSRVVPSSWGEVAP